MPTSFFDQTLDSKIGWSCLLAWLVSQLSKGVIHTIATRKFSPSYYLTGQGGMPSSHSALVTSLFFSIFLQEGLTTLFLISFLFGLITLRDAVGVRQATADHARILNKLMDRFIEPTNEHYTILKELIGHTLTEVIGGIIVAVVCVLIVFYGIY